MKVFFSSILILLTAISGWPQRVYVDISHSESTITNETKLGWGNGLPRFRDEFTFTPSDPMLIGFHSLTPAGCTTVEPHA
jgi:hypothetical protein